MKKSLFALALLGSVSPAFAAPKTVVNPAPSAAPAPKTGASTTTAPAMTANPTTANPTIAADVNGEKIPMSELTSRIEAVKAGEPALQTPSPAATKALDSIKTQMLNDLVTIKLLGQEARRQKISAQPKDIDDSIAQIKSQFKTEAEFSDWLKESGATQTELRARISDELAMDELTQRVTSDVTVSDADVAEYYRAHPEDFTVNAAVKARHILLAVNPNASAADKDAVRKRAQSLIAQIKKGGDFAALAKANSDDQSNKDNGGELPVFERGMMVKPFEDAAFAAKKGDIIGPVETQFGMHIIKIEETLPEKIVELKDVKDDPRLKALILRQKKQARFDAFVAGLKTNAKINKYV